MKNSFRLFVIFVLSRTAFSQPHAAKIYQVANADSSVSILAENHGFAPSTVSLSAELVNMHSMKPLPAKIVVSPAKAPCLLTTLVPDRRPYSFRYKGPYQLGVYTGHAPDTSQVYGLPFRLNTGAAMPPQAVPVTFRVGDKLVRPHHPGDSTPPTAEKSEE